MKAIYTLIIALFSILNTTAQIPQLYGTAKEGGMYEGGTIFSINGDGSNFLKRYDFEQDGGYLPVYTRLLDGGDGYLYALTSQGGYYSDGVIFRINIQNHIVEVLHHLQNFPDSVYLNNHKEGNAAQGSLIMASNGLMYGMCKGGGIYNRGTIFSFNPVNFNYEVVYNFIDSNSIQESGKGPYGSLTQLNDSIFYGLTYRGGINNGNGAEGGVLFKFNLLNKKYTSVYDFTVFPPIASNPRGDLLAGNDGWLYGTAGGPNDNGWGQDGRGILFRYNPTIDSMEKLIDFNDDSIAGKYPNGILTQAANGWIYGTTSKGYNNQGGGGEIFAFDPATHQGKLVHKFLEPADGSFPYGGLTEASDGWLYGTTTQGGSSGYGSVFKLNPATDSVITLKFMNEQETHTQSTFIQLADGNLYSMSNEGGEEMNGTIFKYSPDSNSLETIFEFRVSDHGCHPVDGLVQNVDGKIYGFTHEGGDFHAGVMFSFKPGEDVYEYFEFREDLDAAYLPRGTLSLGPNGKYFGAALYHFDGGATIYSFNPVTLQYQIEKELGDNLLGEKPEGKMLMLPDGNFYGTMSRGGTQDYGTIYRFNPIDAVYDVLYDVIDSTLGIHPTGSFAVWNGYLFGMMDQGGIAGQGTLFRFDPVLNHYDKMIDFVDSVNGKNPAGRLIPGTDGLLYGNTTAGGAKKDGTLFSFNPQNNQLITLMNFDAATSGSKPLGTLLQASDGALYGTASLGGNFNYGTVFRYEPSTANYLGLHHFNNFDGRYPEGELMEYDPSLTAVDEIAQLIILNAYPNPFSDYTTINIKTALQQNLVAVITDVEGKTLLKERVMNKTFIIRRNGLPAGIFFLELRNENGISAARMKLLIQ